MELLFLSSKAHFSRIDLVLSYTKFQNAHERETLVIERSPNFEVYYRQRNNQKIHEASISLQGKIQ